MDFAYTNEQIEEILNWTLSGLTMYYRDSELPADVIAKYQVGHIFRSQTFVDVSAFAGQLTKTAVSFLQAVKQHRFIRSTPRLKNGSSTPSMPTVILKCWIFIRKRVKPSCSYCTFRQKQLTFLKAPCYI